MAVSFEVWAPNAERVEVELVPSGRRVPLAAVDVGDSGFPRPGWWVAVVDDAGPGTRYAYHLDGGPGLPDPRSVSQPEGVHGPSEVGQPIGPSASRPLGTDAWRGFHLPGAVLYEAHVGTFSPEGTFAGMADRLGHLVDLGVDAIEVMPVAEFPGRHGWGYDGVDLFAPHHAYGGPEGLRRLVAEAHAQGLGVVLDVVYNHLGPDGNYLGHFGPYFTDRYATPWGQAVNLDGPGSDEVRAFVIDNALSWFEDYGVDGLRLDAVHALIDRSPRPMLVELGEATAAAAARLGRPLWLIAESDDNDPRLVLPRTAGGVGLDASWSDDFHHALWVTLTGERSGYYADFEGVEDLGRALAAGWVYAGRPSRHRGRRHGADDPRIEAWRRVVCAQNHDQVGNRARGERIAAVAGPRRAQLALAVVLTSPFVPLVFQGEEWAATQPFAYFTDHSDADLARAVTEGRRREFAAFGWDPADVLDPEDPATFELSRLAWGEAVRAEGAETLALVRRLCRLRRAVSWLAAGSLAPLTVEADSTAGRLVVHRGPGVLALNLGPTPMRLPLPAAAEVLASVPAGLSPAQAASGSEVVVPPDGFAVAGPPLEVAFAAGGPTAGFSTGSSTSRTAAPSQGAEPRGGPVVVAGGRRRWRPTGGA